MGDSLYSYSKTLLGAIEIEMEGRGIPGIVGKPTHLNSKGEGRSK